jgi:hypothetical protein
MSSDAWERRSGVFNAGHKRTDEVEQFAGKEMDGK